MQKHPQIAELHKLYLSETQPFRKVHRLIDLFESIIKTHTVLIVSEYVQHNKLSEAAKGLLAQGLRTPSLGTWQLFSRVLFSELARDGFNGFFPSFEMEFVLCDQELYSQLSKGKIEFTAFDKKQIAELKKQKKKRLFFFDDVIAFRNGIAHGATPNDEDCLEDIKKYDPYLHQLLEMQWFKDSALLYKNSKVYMTGVDSEICLHPLIIYKDEGDKPPFAFFNDLKNDKVGLLNYPLSKHYREKDFWNEFHEYLPLHDWKKTGNNEFYQRIEELTETFKGRQMEREELMNFVLSKNKGYFSVLGNPGIGKSALIAQFFKDLKAKEETIAQAREIGEALIEAFSVILYEFSFFKTYDLIVIIASQSISKNYILINGLNYEVKSIEISEVEALHWPDISILHKSNVLIIKKLEKKHPVKLEPWLIWTENKMLEPDCYMFNSGKENEFLYTSCHAKDSFVVSDLSKIIAICNQNLENYANNSAIEYIKKQVPYPIAKSFMTVYNSRSPHEKHIKAIKIAETLLKYMAFIVISSEYNYDSKELGSVLKKITRPASIGSWYGAVRDILKKSDAKNEIINAINTEWNKVLTNKKVLDCNNLILEKLKVESNKQLDFEEFIQNVIRYRNQSGSYENESLAERIEIGEALIDSFLVILHEFSFFKKYDLVAVMGTKSMEYISNSTKLNYILLNGINYEKKSFLVPREVVLNWYKPSVYLLKKREKKPALDLKPWIILTDKGSLYGNECYMFSSSKENRYEYTTGFNKSIFLLSNNSLTKNWNVEEADTVTYHKLLSSLMRGNKEILRIEHEYNRAMDHLMFKLEKINKFKSSLLKMPIEHAKQANYPLAEQTCLEIPQIAQRHACWKSIAQALKKEHGWDKALQLLEEFKNEEARTFYLKGWAESISLEDMSEELIQKALPALEGDRDSIEALLQLYAIRQLFFEEPGKERIARYNKTLNIQWALDIKAQFPEDGVVERRSDNLEEWIGEIGDEDDRDDVRSWADKVQSGKMTEDKFREKVKDL